MSPTVFINHSRKAGLHRPGIGLEAVESLAKLIEAPIAAQPTRREGKWAKTPAPLPLVGSLIKNGLARLESSSMCYVPTEAGKEWLAQIQSKVFKKPTLQHA